MSWTDIPAAERFELLATIREMREWRYGGVEPLRPLPPITQAAVALYEFRVRSGATKSGTKPVAHKSQRHAIRGRRQSQGELHDASAHSRRLPQHRSPTSTR